MDSNNSTVGRLLSLGFDCNRQSDIASGKNVLGLNGKGDKVKISRRIATKRAYGFTGEGCNEARPCNKNKKQREIE